MAGIPGKGNDINYHRRERRGRREIFFGKKGKALSIIGDGKVKHEGINYRRNSKAEKSFDLQSK